MDESAILTTLFSGIFDLLRMNMTILGFTFSLLDVVIFNAILSIAVYSLYRVFDW